jgi:hypothetical protein
MAPIGFTQNARGKWVPTDPSTGKFHRCKLEQTCIDCRGKFEGAPWMKQCPECWKAASDRSHPNKRGFHKPANRKPEGPAPGPKEPLEKQDTFFNDIPF